MALVKKRSSSSVSMESLPVSRGSAVDSELSQLMHKYPNETREFLDDFFSVDTRRRQDASQDTNNNVAPAKMNGKTHYQEIYYEKSQRPRSSKRPLPQKYVPATQPMLFDTWQRVEHKSFDVTKHRRPSPARMEDNYQPNKEPMNAQTNYQAEYITRPLPAAVDKPTDKSINNRGETTKKILQPQDQFFNQTTSSENYRNWKPQPIIRFGEIPVFTNSILYPGYNQDFKTETQTSFVPKQSTLTSSCPNKILENNLKLEGEQDFLTTYANVHRTPKGGRRATIIKQEPQMRNEHQVPILGVTQSMDDFPLKRGGRQKAFIPPLPTVNLKYNKMGDYWDTEQRVIYKGHDVRNHPIPDSFAQDKKPYEPPTEKFHTSTVMMADFVEKDIAEARQPKNKGPQAKTMVGGEFHGQTTSMDHFKNPGPPPVHQRHGDFHEGYKWIPKIYPLLGQSETKAEFVPQGKPSEVVNYKPILKPIAQAGEHDFVTVYQKNFKGRHQLSHEQARLLKKELLQLKMKENGNIKKSVIPKLGCHSPTIKI